MINKHIRLLDPLPRREDRLAHIPWPEFAVAWKALVGEPPSVMLESRSEMIRILIHSAQAAPVIGVEMLAADDQEE